MTKKKEARNVRQGARWETFLKRFANPRNQLSWLVDFALRTDLKESNESERSRLEQELFALCVSLGGEGLAEEERVPTGELLNKLAKNARWLLEVPASGPRQMDLQPEFSL